MDSTIDKIIYIKLNNKPDPPEGSNFINNYIEGFIYSDSCFYNKDITEKVVNKTFKETKEWLVKMHLCILAELVTTDNSINYYITGPRVVFEWLFEELLNLSGNKSDNFLEYKQENFGLKWKED